MADIRKTFNFRDGVQVDDEVLVVRGSRVGLGTTNPDQLLDVRGNTNITGVTSTALFNVTGVGTFGGIKVGTGITLDSTSGVVSATSFKGDGSTLSNLPTSQWTNVNVGAGVSPIYVEGNVGVGTTNPANPFQVGGDPNNGIGVGFSTSGNIKASGIITATSFVGPLTGNVVGNVTGNLTGNADTATYAGVAGIATVAQNLTGSPSITVTNINASGVGTFPNLVTTDLSTVTLKGFNSLRAPHGTTTTIVVTVASKTAAHRYNGSGSSNGFVLDGVEAPYLTLTPGRTYRFDVSSGTNSGHPFGFFYDVDKTSTYTTGVTVNGSAGNAGSYVDLVVSDTTPSVLHYQCSSHAKMGNSVQIGSNILDTEHNSTVRGTMTATSFVGDVTGNVSGNITGTAGTFTTLDINGDVDIDGHAELDALNVSGVITSTSFIGPLTGNVTGNLTGALNSVGISTIGRFISTDISISGVSTFTGNIDANGDLDVDGHTELDQLNVSGIGTLTRAFATDLSVSGVSTLTGNIIANGNIDLAGTLDVDGTTELDDVNVSAGATFAGAIDANGNLDVAGSSTFTGLIDANGGAAIDNIQIGVTGNNEIDTSSGDLTIDSATGLTIIDDNLKISGVTTAGIVTATSLGIGTDTANADIQIHKESGSSSIVIGRNSAVGSNNAQLRFGNTAGSFPYSDSAALDLINYGTGNFNYYIQSGNGEFHWHKGTASRLMTLTNSGNLGIGLTNPTDKLSVTGNVAITGVCTANTFVAGDLQGNLTGNVIGNINSSGNGLVLGNSNVTTGVSTFAGIDVTSTATLPSTGVGIGTTTGGNTLSINALPQHRFFVSTTGSVGIKQETLSDGVELEVNGDVKSSSIAIGDTARSGVDFSAAVAQGDNRDRIAYMLPPRVTTTQRNAFVDAHTQSSSILDGAMIFNTTTGRLEVRMSGNWVGIATVV
tara:strand:+ start:2155 stop:4980 length:2826 start_codon:yes stop_codon:yes gene_type:complete